ncbi:MAG: rod-binding protein [Alphaproteobacteria bacterium]|nr:rod-binding protein [Alphaproteobacteria bacterium]
MSTDILSATGTAALDARPLRAPRADGTPEGVKKAAQDFEAVFLAQMLGHMFEGIETDGIFGGGHGEQMFRSMMVDEYGKQMARRGGIGLADHIEREMLKMQEVRQ